LRDNGECALIAVCFYNVKNIFKYTSLDSTRFLQSFHFQLSGLVNG